MEISKPTLPSPPLHSAHYDVSSSTSWPLLRILGILFFPFEARRFLVLIFDFARREGWIYRSSDRRRVLNFSFIIGNGIIVNSWVRKDGFFWWKIRFLFLEKYLIRWQIVDRNFEWNGVIQSKRQWNYTIHKRSIKKFRIRLENERGRKRFSNTASWKKNSAFIVF